MKYGFNFRKGYRKCSEPQSKKGLYRSCRGKVRFDTEDEAANYQKGVVKLRSRHDERVDKLRLYYCDNCDGFHYTSKLRERNPIVEEKQENLLTKSTNLLNSVCGQENQTSING